MNLDGFGDAEFLNIERSITRLIIAGHRYAPEERTSDFWIDHGETIEFLTDWLFDLQDYFQEKFEE